MKNNIYEDKIKDLRILIEKQDNAIKTALEKDKTLRNFLEFPETVAKTNSNNKSIMFQEGYKQALLDIKNALNITHYLTTDELDDLIMSLK